MRKIVGAIIHCSATRPGWMEENTAREKVEEIRRWHVEGRGWSDIGYHYIIDRSGEVVVGRPIERDGAHTLGKNKGTFGICLIGGHGSAADDMFSEHFTPMQRDSLCFLLGELSERFGRISISGHNDYAAKACPGFDVAEEFTFAAGWVT